MSVIKDFIDRSLRLWRRYRLLDWRPFTVCCVLFITGCVLASMSWRLGASVVFVFLYMLLGTSGLLIAFLKVLQISENAAETLPLFSPAQFKMSQYQEYETSNDKTFQIINIEGFVNTEGKSLNSETKSNISSTNVSVEQNVPVVESLESEKNVDTSNNSIQCVQLKDSPRIFYEQYTTSPAPGGGHSRKTDRGNKEESWHKKLSPLLGPFKQILPTEATAQFHIPLMDMSDIQQDPEISRSTPVSESLPVENIQAESQTTGQSMSPNSQEPIYENIIQYQEHKRIFSESDMMKFLYDTPSTTLRRVSATARDMSPDDVQNFSSSAPGSQSFHMMERNGGNRSRPRLGSFTSPERTYVNVLPSLAERQEKLKRNREDSSPSKYLQGFVAEREACSLQQFNPIIEGGCSKTFYSNPSNDQRTEQTQVHGSGSKNSQHSLSESKNIYMNALPLGPQTEEQRDKCDIEQNYSKAEKYYECKDPPVSPTQENIYMNLPLSRVHVHQSTFTSKKILTDRHDNVSSESEWSADTEIESSETQEHFADAESRTPNKIYTKRRDTNRSRSEYMYVTGLGPTLKSYVKPGISSIETINSKLDNYHSMKNDNLFSSAAFETSDAEITLASVSGSTKIQKLKENSCDAGRNLGDTILNPTEVNRVETPEKVQQNIRSQSLPSAQRENIGLTGTGEYFIDTKTDSSVYLSSANRLERETGSEYLCKTDKVSNDKTFLARRTGLNTRKNIDQESKTEYDNPLYGENTDCTANKTLKIDNREDIVLTEKGQNLGSKEYLSPEISSVIKTLNAPSFNNSQSREIISNETFLINPETSNSSLDLFGKSRNLNSFSETEENIIIPPKQATLLATSDDEDSFCLSKSLTECKITASESRDSPLLPRASEIPSNSNSTFSASFTKHSVSNALLQHDDTQWSAGPENIFSPKKPLHLTRTRKMSTTSMDERFIRSFNTLLEIPSVKMSKSPDAGNTADVPKSPSILKKSPRIHPPLGRTLSNPIIRSSPSEGTFPSSKVLDLPVILNRSSIVQSQIQKFSANTDKKLDSVHTVNPLERPREHLTHAPQHSSTTMLHSDSHPASIRKQLYFKPTDQISRHELFPATYQTPTPETSPSTRSSDIPLTLPKRIPTTNTQPKVPRIATEPSTLLSKSPTISSVDDESPILRRHKPVYF